MNRRNFIQGVVAAMTAGIAALFVLKPKSEIGWTYTGPDGVSHPIEVPKFDVRVGRLDNLHQLPSSPIGLGDASGFARAEHQHNFPRVELEEELDD